MAKFVYLDESGDTGFKFRRGSSRYFVVVLLLVDDPIPIHAAIDDLRRSLSFAPRSEFRFSHTAEDVRRRFLHELNRHSISIRALVVDKSSLAPERPRDQVAFYHRVLRLVVGSGGERIRDATLVLDESVTIKRRQRAPNSFLRQALSVDPGAPKLRDIVHHASHTDNLIQAVDMVAGAIHVRFSRDDSSYLEIIKNKIEELWVPKPEESGKV